MPPSNSNIDSISITEEEVFNASISLDPTKATGIDGISPAVLKYLAHPLTKPLHYVFSYAIFYCCLPSEWQIHCIIPIFKTGSNNSVSKYRPIPLLCIVSKTLKRIINDKVSSAILDHISTRQFGFMKGRSTLQQLYSSFSNISMNMDHKQTSLSRFLKSFRSSFS